MTTQKNALLDVLESSGFSRHDFKWTSSDADWLGYLHESNPALRYVGPKDDIYFFTIGILPVESLGRVSVAIRRKQGEFAVSYSPGTQTQIEKEYQLEWDEVVAAARTWARRLREEVDAVDRWKVEYPAEPFAQLLAGEPVVEGVLPPDQRDTVLERLNQLQERLQTYEDVVKAVRDHLSAELDAVKLDVATLERKQAERSVISWFWRLATAGLQWDRITELYEILVTGVGQLPPGGG